MDTYVLLHIALALGVIAAVLLLYREVRRLGVAVATASQMDPCQDGLGMRMRCVDKRLQDIERRS